jgi:hypothetical protein
MFIIYMYVSIYIMMGMLQLFETTSIYLRKNDILNRFLNTGPPPLSTVLRRIGIVSIRR